jgi:hypothetical protein
MGVNEATFAEMALASMLDIASVTADVVGHSGHYGKWYLTICKQLRIWEDFDHEEKLLTICEWVSTREAVLSMCDIFQVENTEIIVNNLNC